VPVAHLVQVIQAEAEEKLAQPHLHRVLGVVHNVLPKERLGSNGGKLGWPLVGGNLFVTLHSALVTILSIITVATVTVCNFQEFKKKTF
jgi:hypothetical protein